MVKIDIDCIDVIEKRLTLDGLVVLYNKNRKNRKNTKQKESNRI